MNEHVGANRRRGSTGAAAVLLGLAVVGAIAKRTAPAGSGADRRGSDAVVNNAPSVSPGASPVAHPPGLVGLGRAVIDRVGRDNITLVAAGIAFYVMLSIFPGLAALVSLYGLVGDPADVSARLADYSYLLPPEAFKLISDGLNSFAQKSNSQLSVALATSVVLALWTARAGISSVMTGLNIAYEEEEKRSFIVQTLVALGLTLAGIVVAVAAFLAIAIVPIVLKFLYLDGMLSAVLSLARWPVLALMVILGFAVVYRWAPCRSHPRWRWITWGSSLATLFWLVGSILFSVYVSKFGSYDATYGSLGAVVVLLLWLWVSALIMLIGAEIDSELDIRATMGGAPLAGTAPSVGPPVGTSR